MTCLRSNSPAADNKTDYVIDVLNRCGYSVELISHSSISIPGFYFKGKVENRGHNTIRYFGSFGVSKFKILNVLNWVYRDIVFLTWCLFHIKREEQIIVYHSLGYDSIFIWLNRIKRLKIVGEIEEIYQDVHKQSARRSRNEYRFISGCNKYIFPTSSLDSKLNCSRKPAAIIHGIYSVEPRRDIISFDNGKIHVVYAGTLDPQKGGAAAAATTAAYLPDNYHIHILGFGDKEQVETISQVIKDVNAFSQAVVSYDGYLQGEDFICYLQKCQIGLSTQDPTAIFNATSFPSKILTYLSNGLRVVTVRIPVIEKSSVGKSMFYYDKQEPEEIARAIIQCSEAREPVDSISLLNELDKRFVNDLAALLE